ncbi:hypothetical protein GVN20_04495 [Runella sp. CRIBMP]|uniref:hypothetical protein n=1 Tax=Runella sp. CRIBMP TaxID=2683261 RepID=UPI001412D1C2|nr:hypothetical protein [Runella sp. CRIBMP]NBB18608.1 hypothetical protein [Runella sp. CRIBMP]
MKTALFLSLILLLSCKVIAQVTLSPNAANKVDVSGAIRSSTLSGSNQRPVVATPDGVLIPLSPDSVSYLSIPPSAFRPSSSSVFYSIGNFNSVYLGSGANADLSAPVYLPHRARIKEIKACYYDNNADNNLNMILWQYNPQTLTGNGYYSLTTSGQSGTVRCGTFNNFNPVEKPYHTIDNKNSYYALEVRAAPLTWTGIDMGIISVHITYFPY